MTEMMGAGIHYGHKKSKTNPKMRPYIAATRNNIEIIDLQATLRAFDEAVGFLKEKKSKNALMLLVATQPAAKEIVERLADKFGYPCVTNRWLGGTLTNFNIIRKRVERFQQLRQDKESGNLDKYTKKERLRFDQTLFKMDFNFRGLERLARLPDAILMVNINIHDTALREALRLKIPVVAIVDTDSDPGAVDYPIPANDNARASIDWILNRIEKELEAVVPVPEKNEEASAEKSVEEPAAGAASQTEDAGQEQKNKVV